MTSRDRIRPPPRDLDEALERARRHALAAAGEAASALRALVDAASLAASGAPSDAHAWLARASAWLDAAAEQSGATNRMPRFCAFSIANPVVVPVSNATSPPCVRVDISPANSSYPWNKACIMPVPRVAVRNLLRKPSIPRVGTATFRASDANLCADPAL